jgi:hypothetical protein
VPQEASSGLGCPEGIPAVIARARNGQISLPGGSDELPEADGTGFEYARGL